MLLSTFITLTCRDPEKAGLWRFYQRLSVSQLSFQVLVLLSSGQALSPFEVYAHLIRVVESLLFSSRQLRKLPLSPVPPYV